MAHNIKTFLPENFDESRILAILKEYNCNLKITKPRKTKLGDFKMLPNKEKSVAITLNNNLNPYSFTITLLHEVAHLLVYKNHNRRVNPHGKEWKQEFKLLMNNYLHIFPSDIQIALVSHFQNPKASSCTDINLQKILKKYDTQTNTNSLHLEDISDNSFFMLTNGRKFLRVEKIRKRIKCRDFANNRIYTVHPLTEVKLEAFES